MTPTSASGAGTPPSSGGRASLRLSFQGEPGAFSHEVARRAFGDGADTVACRTFDEMFAKVVSGEVEGAIVPIENTLVGSVIRNYDLLAEHDLVVAGELVMRIVHNLIACPGATLADIKKVYSHPVALGQCERFFKDHPTFEAADAYDTAGAVKLIMAAGRKEDAAIASRIAAEVYGAALLAAGIESNHQNYTRFFVMAKPENVARFPFPAGAAQRTTLLFRIGNRPGGLHAALGGFAREGVDLTKIESRPIEGHPWEYSFYVDLQGVITDPQVARAVDSLRELAQSVRVLGSYARLSFS
jgi:prephenate dehydratase